VNRIDAIRTSQTIADLDGIRDYAAAGVLPALTDDEVAAIALRRAEIAREALRR